MSVTHPMPTDLNCFAVAVTGYHAGDTFHARFSPLPNLWWEGRIRAARCDSPELSKPGGQEAAAWTLRWLTDAAPGTIRIKVIGADNYGGRLDCEVWRTVDGHNWSDDLLQSQHADPMKLAAQLAVP
jgi:hypothetical protein